MNSEISINGKTIEITDEEKQLLRSVASSSDEKTRAELGKAIAQVVEGAWKSGVLEPDLLDNIYTVEQVPAGAEAKFPLDFFGPSDQGNYKAFLMPKEGAIPTQAIEGDELFVPTFKIANSIDWSLDYVRDARWNVVARAIEVFTNGFTQRMNDDGWHVILQAASENSIQDDTNAAQGIFTTALLTTMQTAIKRLTGGRNSRLTDLYISPEGIADIRNLASFQLAGVTNDPVVLDDETIRSLILGPEDRVPSLFGVRLHELQELGTGQEYETYLTNTVGVSHTGSDEEFVVGLDLNTRDQFVMPVKEEMSMFDDPNLHRSARAGVYGWLEVGFAALDNRRAILGEF